MGICDTMNTSKLPKSTIYGIDNDKEKIFKNALGIINFKELFSQSLSPEFLKLFKNNINLFYSKPFLEGISYEYGLMDKSINKTKAFNAYKDGADNKYDYFCMYRLHRIFLNDYKNFNLERNIDLDRLYLYKCFAYLPFSIINKTYFLFNKINIIYETAIFLDEDNQNTEKKFETFERFIKHLLQNPQKYNLTSNDVHLMNNVILCTFFSDAIRNKIEFLDCFLNFKKEDGYNAYYESQLKYCNFYLKNSEKNSDKSKIKKIFNNLIKNEYYKATYDFGIFLMNEGKYNEAKNIFRKGMENSQQFCLSEYTFIILRENDLNQLKSDYKIISFFFQNMFLVISHENLSLSSTYYAFYYLTKYSPFKEKLKNDYIKYINELYQNMEKKVQINNIEYTLNNYAEMYLIEIPYVFGIMCYYGTCDYLNPNKETALIYFKSSYKLAKEKKYIYNTRINYLFIYKCRKYLYKNQKISLIKLNKTKEKLFRFYENENEDNLDSLEFYNYYKLYKICVTGNIQNKLIHLLKKGKNIKIYYSFIVYIYTNKCKIALDKEYSNISSLNQSKIILKNEEDINNINKINLDFRTMEGGKSYKIAVSKDIQFFKVVHKLFNNYPELEEKRIGTYICDAKKISLFDTVGENGLQEGSVILIINQFK